MGTKPWSRVGDLLPACLKPAGAGWHLGVCVVFQNGHPQAELGLLGMGLPSPGHGAALSWLPLWLVLGDARHGFDLCWWVHGPQAARGPRVLLQGAWGGTTLLALAPC